MLLLVPHLSSPPPPSATLPSSLLPSRSSPLGMNANYLHFRPATLTLPLKLKLRNPGAAASLSSPANRSSSPPAPPPSLGLVPVAAATVAGIANEGARTGLDGVLGALRGELGVGVVAPAGGARFSLRAGARRSLDTRSRGSLFVRVSDERFFRLNISAEERGRTRRGRGVASNSASASASASVSASVESRSDSLSTGTSLATACSQAPSPLGESTTAPVPSRTAYIRRPRLPRLVRLPNPLPRLSANAATVPTEYRAAALAGM